MSKTEELFPDTPPTKKKSRRRPLTDPPEELSPADLKRLKAWCRKHYPQYCHRHPGGLRDLIANCFDYHIDKGKQRRDWVAAIRMWVRKEAQFKYERKCRYNETEKPQYDLDRRSQEGLETLGEVIPLIPNFPLE